MQKNWSQDEIDALTRLFRAGHNPLYIADRLNRTRWSVTGKLTELGITKSKDKQIHSKVNVTLSVEQYDYLFERTKSLRVSISEVIRMSITYAIESRENEERKTAIEDVLRSGADVD